MLNLQIETLRRLPRRADETWQSATFRMPAWVPGEDDEPTRPLSALCVTTGVRLLGIAEPRVSAPSESKLVLESVVSVATDDGVRFRPGRLEVRRPEAAAELQPLLADLGIEVVVREELVLFEEARQELFVRALDGEIDAAALLVPGVTIDHLRGFAAAAAEFHDAAPWRRFSDEDLISVTSPKPPAGLGWLAVMGAGGRQFGLAFFDSRRAYERIFEVPDPGRDVAERPMWLLTFESLMDLPFGDADAWEDHALALSQSAQYPYFARFAPDSSIQRPTPRQWTYAEGLLRAIARSTEAEMDSGTWSRVVPTYAGEVTYTLTLPELLEPLEFVPERRKRRIPDPRTIERIQRGIARSLNDAGDALPDQNDAYPDANIIGSRIGLSVGSSQLERAQDLAYLAVESGGRRRLQVARAALEICADCADAYVILAEAIRDGEEALGLYEQGVAAGRRTLGAEAFESDAVQFWEQIETRPYMRALRGLALSCEQAGRDGEARAYYEELLRLNPADNQGVRYLLANLLAREGDLDRLEALLNRFDEQSAQFEYIRALWSFRKFGDCERSRACLSAAERSNRHVRKYLLETVEWPETPPGIFEPGEDSEAVQIAFETLNAWTDAPGALEWLENCTKSKRSGHRRRRRR